MSSEGEGVRVRMRMRVRVRVRVRARCIEGRYGEHGTVVVNIGTNLTGAKECSCYAAQQTQGLTGDDVKNSTLNLNWLGKWKKGKRGKKIKKKGYSYCFKFSVIHQ